MTCLRSSISPPCHQNGTRKAKRRKECAAKSFKSQVKELAIDGAYDTKKDERPDNDPDGFFALLNLPEDVWYAHHVKGREIQDGFSDTTMASLPKALSMLKGKVRKEHWDPYILGSLESPAQLMDNSSNTVNSAKASELNTPVGGSTPAASSRLKVMSQTLAPGQDPSRSRRSVKKRPFGDGNDSYGDGFDDDGGSSTGDGEDRNGTKRRKRLVSVTLLGVQWF
ncbi:unnamed protein product [Parascedosporium putredinis]|uniref:Mediator of RNA polymerase II transcription subunit 19 n=1 Tax=Parascedosporium putredinis TaxID=1442378 RepID=A0A9P1GUX7_9PEZI|nr:unnamed protein product [Parascedosporium putredinis]CAI7987556.1 unnamed protein product [Parascedosporium putredinis]